MIVILLLPLILGVSLPLIRFVLYAIRGEDRFNPVFRTIGDICALIILPCLFFIMVEDGIRNSVFFYYPCSLLLVILIGLSVFTYFLDLVFPVSLRRPVLRVLEDVFLLLGAVLAILTGVQIMDGGIYVTIPIAITFLVSLHSSYRVNRNLLSSNVSLQGMSNAEVLDDPRQFIQSERESISSSLSPIASQLFSLHWSQYLILLISGLIGVLGLAAVLGTFFGLPLDCIIATFTDARSGYFLQL